MPEIGTSGLMSGDGKRGVAEWPKLPRPSSTLPKRTWLMGLTVSGVGCEADLTVATADFRVWPTSDLGTVKSKVDYVAFLARRPAAKC